MDAYEFKHIPDLTEEEKKSPYAQFYYEPILPPEPEVFKAIQPGYTIDPILAPSPQDIGKIFVPGALKVENGYCLLPDGIGFSIIHTFGPNITPEMYHWWRPWFTSSDYNYLNYKIWLPSLHFTHDMPIWENLGWGPVKIYFTKPISADDLNLPASPKELNHDFLAIGGGPCTIVPDNPRGETFYATLLHYFTSGGNWLDMKTCVWSGVHILDGKPVRMIPENKRVDIEYVRLFATHNAWEDARKVRLLPQLYEYNKTLKK